MNLQNKIFYKKTKIPKIVNNFYVLLNQNFYKKYQKKLNIIYIANFLKNSNSRMFHRRSFFLLITLFLLVNISYTIVDRTFFNYLGLKITATSSQIEQAYQIKKQKIQALENQEQKNKKLTLLQTAYKALINEQQREKYQRYGKDTFQTIKQITSVNPFSGMDARKGPTINIKLPVSIEDIYNGITVKALYQTRQACSKCMGTGADSPKHLSKCGTCAGKGFSLIDGRNRYGQPQKFQGVCPHCQGSGKHVSKQCNVCHGKKIVDTLKTIQVKIPSKFQGKELKLKNYGFEQQMGAPSDFLVQIQQIPSKLWRRNGQHLFYTFEISLQEAIFGFSKTLQHLSGQQILIQRNEITTKQTKLNFPGKGFSQKGRLTVQFKINIPNFTDRQLDMWETFFSKYNV